MNGVSSGANLLHVCAVYIDFVLFVRLGCSRICKEERDVACVLL